jgi:hypothetical protein
MAPSFGPRRVRIPRGVRVGGVGTQDADVTKRRPLRGAREALAVAACERARDQQRGIEDEAVADPAVERNPDLRRPGDEVDRELDHVFGERRELLDRRHDDVVHRQPADPHAGRERVELGKPPGLESRQRARPAPARARRRGDRGSSSVNLQPAPVSAPEVFRTAQRILLKTQIRRARGENER